MCKEGRINLHMKLNEINLYSISRIGLTFNFNYYDKERIGCFHRKGIRPYG